MVTVPGLLVLGPVRVAIGERTHSPRPTQADLLAALLLHRGGPVPASELSMMVWGEYRRSALHPAVSRLRGWLSEVTAGAAKIAHRDNEYLVVTDGWTDTGRFDDHAAAAGHGDADARLASWLAALDLVRGVPAEGTRPTVREHASAREWSLRHATAITEATQLAIRLDRADALIDRVATAHAHHPDSEYVQASWALLLTATGRRPEALEHLEQYRNRLAERFGTSPSSEYFHTAMRRILRHRPAKAPPPPAGRPAQGRWWGDRITSVHCIGRGAAVEELEEVVAHHDTVTLVGPGGIGKSTLANEIAERELRRRNIVSVALQAATGFDDVIAALAAACKVTDSPLSDRVAAVLAEGDWILLLDNCDQIGEAVAAAVMRLRSTNTRLKVLATSRSPLGIGGERVWRVDPLQPPGQEALTDGSSSAVQLFHQVARRYHHRFQPDRSEREAIGRLCRMVDGMPLAIEILASRTHIFTAGELVENLASYDAALDLSHPVADPRHRSMASTLNWSFDRVPEPARRLLAAVSPLAAPFTVELAAAVSGEPAFRAAALLSQLVDHSLLQPVRRTGQTRFLALEPIRQHAYRLLAEADKRTVTGRFIDHWRTFARKLDAIPRYRDRVAYAQRYQHDAAHLALAVQLADRCEDTHAGTEILARGFEYWMCGYDLPGRGAALLNTHAKRAVPDPEIACLLTYWAGLQAALRYDYTEAENILGTVVDDLAVHRPREHRQALLILATCANSRLDPDAVNVARSAIASIGDDIADGAPFVAACCGMATAITWGRYELAKDLADRHDRLAATAEHRPSNTNLALRAELAIAVGDITEAAVFSAKLLRRLRSPGSVGDIEPIYCAITRTHLARGHAAAAARTAQRGIADLGDRWSQATSRTLALRVLYAEALRRIGDAPGARHQLRHVLAHADGFARMAFVAVLAVAAVAGDSDLAKAWESLRSRLGLPRPPALEMIAEELIPTDGAPITADELTLSDLVDWARRVV